jgi:cytochrome c553
MVPLLRRLVSLAAVALLAVAASAGQDPATAGQAIYRDGVRASGKPLVASGAAGVTRRGPEAACIGCHRRSGFGIAEGQLVVRPITASDIFGSPAAPAGNPRIEHQLGTRRRPVYDAATLARAIRSGIDAEGHVMHPMMPRYDLDDDDMAALQAYLKTLYPAPDPGVDARTIRLATVIQPGVAPEKRRAMLEVLQAFVHDKNAAVRSEPARRSAGGMRMHRAWRSWVLDVWELEGAPDSWGAQLERFYRRAPVFALVAGIGSASWQPVHDFSERLQVPCILPLTSLPGDAPGFYTIYFSRGMALEAGAVARDLGRLPQGSRVLQAWRAGDPEGAAGARALQAALAGTGLRLEQRMLTGAPEAPGWIASTGGDPAALVLWLRAPDLKGGAALSMPVYVSGTMLDGAAPPGANVQMAYPWELPRQRAARVRRSTDWLRARGLGTLAPQVAIDTRFAVEMTGEALAHLMDSFSRDYFVETVEHQVSGTLLASSYPPLTLGPDQRFASKGLYLTRSAASGGEPMAASALIVP